MAAFRGVDTATLLQSGMKVASMNHRIISNNIANVDTPNYNPAELDFQAALRSVIEGKDRTGLRRTDPRHIDGGRNLLKFEQLARFSKNDYNKVDLESEVAKLDQNTGRYTMYGSLLIKRFQQHRDLINNAR